MNMSLSVIPMIFEEIEEDTKQKYRALCKANSLYLNENDELTIETTDRVIKDKDFERVCSYYKIYINQNKGSCAPCKARKLAYTRDCFENLCDEIIRRS